MKYADARKYVKNRDAIIAYSVNWRKNNLERYNSNQMKRYHRSPELKERRYWENKAWRAANPERLKEQMAKFRRENREKCRLVGLNYRSKKKGSPGFDYTTNELIKARWAMWGGKCWICGDVATATDHVKPISKDGAHWPCNLRPACKFCNTGKKNKWPFTVHKSPEKPNLLFVESVATAHIQPCGDGSWPVHPSTCHKSSPRLAS